MGLSIKAVLDGQDSLVVVSGEVDVSNAPELRDALDDSLAAGATNVLVDLSDVPYIDSTGIGVLVGFAHRAAEGGVGFKVTGPQRNVARVLALLGLTEALGIAE